MCLTNCECIEPLLAPFKRKRNGGSRPLPQRTVLAGILYKCRSGCQCPMLPACYGSKSTVHEHFQRWSKAGVMAEIFAYFSQSMERRLASMPNGKLWTAPCCTPRRALKKSATEGIGCNPTDRGRSGGKIHLHVDGQGIPLGVTATGANVHDSHLIGAPLKNFREMGSWFLRADVRHLCLDKGYDYPRVSEEVYVNGFEEHIHSRGRSPGRPEASCIPLGGGTNIRLVERFPKSAYAFTVAPSSILLVCFTLRWPVFFGEN